MKRLSCLTCMDQRGFFSRLSQALGLVVALAVGNGALAQTPAQRPTTQKTTPTKPAQPSASPQSELSPRGQCTTATGVTTPAPSASLQHRCIVAATERVTPGDTFAASDAVRHAEWPDNSDS